ncbi:unnamed protein product [Closterium sp. NIES-54]
MDGSTVHPVSFVSLTAISPFRDPTLVVFPCNPTVTLFATHYRLSEEARAVIKAFYLRLREHSHPLLSEEARAVIKAFYLRLREHSRAMDGPPITARQLESLVRLAEARARVELREEVTEADAQEAVELMGECLLDKLSDEAGNIDAGRGGSSSKSKESKRFLATLQRTAKQAIKTCFSRKVRTDPKMSG